MKMGQDDEASLAAAIQAERVEAAGAKSAAMDAAVADTLAKLNPSRFGVAMVPFTPVDFGTNPLMAWGRIAIYGTAAYMLWGKSKTLSYAALAAGGISLATSLSAKAMK